MGLFRRARIRSVPLILAEFGCAGTVPGGGAPKPIVKLEIGFGAPPPGTLHGIRLRRGEGSRMAGVWRSPFAWGSGFRAVVRVGEICHAGRGGWWVKRTFRA